MVANFRVHEINRGACKLIRTPLLKKKIKVEKKKQVDDCRERTWWGEWGPVMIEDSLFNIVKAKS
jgi:hypothetical protein